MARLLVIALAVLSGCGAVAAPSAAPSLAIPSAGPATVPAAPSPSVPEQVPAPGSTSTVYAPNPAAIVVYIDPGHGGCLDWGVPNPFDNRVENSEKAMTLGIANELRRLLEAEGISVVMSRGGDVALAGDHDPEFGCAGAAFRDVDGDGRAGFDDPEGRVRGRDELAARIDRANLARADLLLSIHVNSITEDGVVYEIAATESFYTDETPWGTSHSARLAGLVQAGVVDALSTVAGYAREDRGVQAVNFYIVSPSMDDPTDGPRRAILMPGVLTEVGSMSLAAEAGLLASTEGQAVLAAALLDAVAAYLADRPLAARYDAEVPGGAAGRPPDAVAGSGPPFWPPTIAANGPTASLRLGLTNTGTQPWPVATSLVAGWAATNDPYPGRPPPLRSVDVDVPALGPGASTGVELPLPVPSGAGRQVAWITLESPDGPFTDAGVPPLLLALEP